MIKPSHSPFHCWLIDKYIGYILKTDFYDVTITGNINPNERSVLLIPNHFSWWDGFFAWHLNKKLFKKRYHVMMLEKELAKRKFFSKAGAFSINLNSRSIINSLNYCQQILSNPNNLLLMFPQGRLESQHHSGIKFRKGIERIAKQSPEARIIFAACLTDYYSHRKPCLTIALKEHIGERDLISMEKSYNEHLNESIIQQDKRYVL
ncbi:MAG: lysophospholipid acyltransferase family protein [Bacteroidales bacterium]